MFEIGHLFDLAAWGMEDSAGGRRVTRQKLEAGFHVW